MKYKVFILICISFLLISCCKKNKEAHTISLFEIALSEDSVDMNFFIKSYCKADLSHDSVFAQLSQNS